MNWKQSALLVSAGALLGFTLKTSLTKLPIRPEYALKLAKARFKELGSVSGSWIYMKPETLTLHGLNYTVYRGGITRTINDTNTQYEFFVDADTGSIISTKETQAII